MQESETRIFSLRWVGGYSTLAFKEGGKIIYESPANYLDERAIVGLREHIERGTLTKLSGKGVGEGFSAIVNQAKLSVRAAEPQEDITPTRTRTPTGVWEQVFLIIEALRTRRGTDYFNSLDQAFLSAPEAEDGCVWVCVRDKFTLTNSGGAVTGLRRNPHFEKLANEQRFVFKIDPVRSSYVERDDYFRRPKRPWRLTMVASFSRSPRRSCWPFYRCFEWDDECFYFHRHHLVDIPLYVFGAYLKSGLQTMIIPYAIWA
jgi:hypothetical protein